MHESGFTVPDPDIEAAISSLVSIMILTVGLAFVLYEMYKQGG